MAWEDDFAGFKSLRGNVEAGKTLPSGHRNLWGKSWSQTCSGRGRRLLQEAGHVVGVSFRIGLPPWKEKPLVVLASPKNRKVWEDDLAVCLGCGHVSGNLGWCGGECLGTHPGARLAVAVGRGFCRQPSFCGEELCVCAPAGASRRPSSPERKVFSFKAQEIL